MDPTCVSHLAPWACERGVMTPREISDKSCAIGISILKSALLRRQCNEVDAEVSKKEKKEDNTTNFIIPLFCTEWEPGVY